MSRGRMSQRRTWDIFCSVVDNYGDAAISWRLAQQLAAEHDATVRLWISDLTPLHALCPDIAIGVARQSVAAVEVRIWPAAWDGIRPADIVIEAFGCGLPDPYVGAMAASTPHPLWIVLEYLSAEPWVPEHHGLASPHPQWAISRYFFFPGFVPGTGGVLREAELTSRRFAFRKDARGRAWQSFGFAPPAQSASVVSIWAYDDAPIDELLIAWRNEPVQTIVGLPRGKMATRIGARFGFDADVGAPQRLEGGNVEVRVLPFVAQPQYDELLWSCDCNFVRGEDSFVRAQWAALPFVWNIYPQAEGAHWRKLSAFLDLYCAGLESAVAAAVQGLWRAWNGIPDSSVGGAWREYWAHREALVRHAPAWAARLAESTGDLATNLAKFCAERVKY